MLSECEALPFFRSFQESLIKMETTNEAKQLQYFNEYLHFRMKEHGNQM